MTKHYTVGELEQLLLQKYPVQDAENWDKTGLLAGNPARVVTGVIVALDPTFAVLEQAKKTGANVVLTHHPAFLQAPERFFPEGTPFAALSDVSGSLVYAAINHNIALMNFHTALDVSEEGLLALPRALGLSYEQTLLPLNPATKGRCGYGVLCTTTITQTVHELASRCKQVLNGNPRIWGNMNTRVRSVATAQGSASSVLFALSQHNVDCLVCGELKYHDALAAAQTGLNIIELGHDVSEQVLVDVLYQTVTQIGVKNVVKLPCTKNWTTL